MSRIVCLACVLCLPLAAGFRAGASRVKITPPLPAHLSGYGARTAPAGSVSLDLWTKVLALDDGEGGRFVLVTADLIGFTKEVTGVVAEAAEQRYGLRRHQILFNASHTHSGPSVWPRLHVSGANGPDIDRQVQAWAAILQSHVIRAIGMALADLRPARAEFTAGTAGFAINRRTEQLARIRPGEQFPAPVDHSVPVLRITGPGRALKAVVFGYACHNTTLTGHFTEISGDYAGYAQAALETRYPGAIALFVALCGADQNPSPRSQRALAQQHGEALASAVAAALEGKPQDTTGRIRSAYENIQLPFQAHTRDVYQAETRSSDPFLARRGKLMVEAFDAGRPIISTPYPVQSFRLGEGPAWVALGGEVVLDYQVRLKREFGQNRIVVAGYSNDVMGYIPSLRIQREGGYEAGDSLVYFSQPGWFTDQVEELVIAAAHRSLAQVGLAPSNRARSPRRPARGRPRE